MKIEKVTFENINSLGGRFEVDFTHPSLSDGGIFVISGPTGVGKTSLLDAISFALYGKTARQDAVSNTVNELMTRGTMHCMAEVQFEKDGRRYVARSFQRRRRGRSEDSQPFSPIERGLATLAEDGTVTPLGEQKVRNVNDSVEELTGLTFSNFYRCMMLAQGEFARFLQAGEKERSEVLATITGTEIYQQIGEVVHAHKAALERELESRQRRETLSPEAREAAERSRDEAAKTLGALAEKAKGLAEAAAWLESLSEAKEACAQSQANLQQAKDAIEAFRESGGQADLALAEAAQAVAPLYTELQGARKALDVCRQTMETEARFLADHAPALQAAEAAEKEALGTWNTQEPDIQARLKHLREVIRPQEQKAALAVEQAQAAEKAAGRAQGGVRSATEAQGKSQTAAGDARTRLERCQAALAEVQADAALAEYLPTLGARFSDWQTATRRYKDRVDTAPEPTADLRRRQAELEATRAGLLGGGNRADLDTKRQRLARLQERDTEAAQAQADAKAAADKTAAAEQALAALPDLATARKLVESFGAKREALVDCASLQEQLAKLCRDFQNGTLPHCPCCGNTTPPAEAPHPLPAALLLVEREWEAAKETLQKLEDRHAALQRDLSQAKGRAASCNAALEKACAALSQARQALGLAETPADLPQLLALATAAVERLDAAEAGLAALATRLDLAEKRDAFLHELAPCCKDTPAHVAAAGKLLATLTTRRDTYNTRRDAVRAAESALALADQQFKNDTDALATALATEDKAQAEAATARQAAKDLEAALLEARGPEPSAITEAHLLQSLDTLRKAKDDTRAAAEAERAVRAKHEPLLQKARQDAPGLAEDAQHKETAFTGALAANNLDGTAAYMAACTKLPRLAELRRQRESLATALTGAETQAKLMQERLQALADKQATTLSAVELQQERDATETLRAQQNDLLVELLTKIRTDDEARAFNAGLEAELEGKRREWDEWTMLADILGRSKDGFKRYAQKITFDLLIHHANAQLRALNDRYTLEQGEAVLSLCVRDRYQDDEARSCSNLSGGEAFVVSLALALGLSRMSGRTRIDSLFLDEGFGTLDENTLSHVLACLQTLQADGKQVGIISHVQRLKNEIGASLELQPRANHGLSTFAPHPAVTARPGDIAIPHSPEARQAETLARQRQAVLAALAAGPSREKELRAATGIEKGLRNILKTMAGQGLLTYDGKLYALPETP